MITILRIDVSARKERSLTRGLSGRFIDEWLKQRPSDKIVHARIASPAEVITTFPLSNSTRY